MRATVTAWVAAALVMAAMGLAAAQDKSTSAPSRMATRSVVGTVTSTASDAIVVRGMESDKEREWAFSVDGTTTVHKAGQHGGVATLKEGDQVRVEYAERDGKIIARSVTVNGAGVRPFPR